jgi:hypothetical protein
MPVLIDVADGPQDQQAEHHQECGPLKTKQAM